jgi:hypothetical protein
MAEELYCVYMGTITGVIISLYSSRLGYPACSILGPILFFCRLLHGAAVFIALGLDLG